MQEITAQDLIEELRAQIAELSFQIAVQNATIRKLTEAHNQNETSPEKPNSVTE